MRHFEFLQNSKRAGKFPNFAAKLILTELANNVKIKNPLNISKFKFKKIDFILELLKSILRTF